MDTVKKRGRIIVLSLAFLVLAVAAVFWARGRFSSPVAGSVKPVAVLTSKPVRTDIAVTLSIPAILEPARSTNVIPRVSGMLLDVRVQEGDQVKTGDLLAQIDPQPYEMELLSAKSAWLFSESRLERVRQLYESSGASRQQLEEVQTARDAAYSSYELAKMRREYAELRAPSDGLVLRRFADPGSMASTVQPLFIIGDTSRSQMKVQIPEKYWDSFSGSIQPKVRVFRPGDADENGDETGRIDAEILRVAPSISPQTRTFDVVCALTAGDVPWPMGTRLHVDFVLDEQTDVWALSRQAVSSRGVLWWVNTEDSTAHALEPGELFQNDQYVAVPEQWADRLFVTEGYERLTDGQIVRTVGEGV